MVSIPGTRSDQRLTATDVSEQGGRIRLKEQLAIGTKLDLCLYPPNLFIPIQVEGEVCWRKFDIQTKHYVHGIHFNNFPGDYQRVLKTYVDEAIRLAGKSISINEKVRQLLYRKVLAKLIKGSQVGRRALEGRADSGVSFDNIYTNRASGSTPLGRLVDKVLLALPAAKASRDRKNIIQEAIKQEIAKNKVASKKTLVVDLACGASRYLIESIGPDELQWVQGLCIDQDQEAINAGRLLAGSLPLRFLRLNVFKTSRLNSISQSIDWHPNLVISSGLIYYLTDKQVKFLLDQIFQFMAPGGLFILTNMIDNPNKELVGRLFTTHTGESWIPLSRRPHLVREWLQSAGFCEIHHTIEPHRMYAVFCSRKPEGTVHQTPFELNINGFLTKGKLSFPIHKNTVRGHVLFVHGLGYTYSAYQVNPDTFCNAGYSFCAFNMAGHGTSEGEWTMQTSVNSLKLAIERLSTSTSPHVPVYLFAHSTGALIAFLAAENNPLVAGIASINIVTSVTDSYFHWHKTGYNEKVRDLCRMNGKLPAVIKEWLDSPEGMIAFQNRSRPWSELRFPCRYGLMKASTFENLGDVICFSPNLLQRPPITIPSLLFVGKNDEVIPVEKSLSLYRILEGPRKLIQTGSTDHFQKESWKDIQDEVISFFKKAPSS